MKKAILRYLDQLPRLEGKVVLITGSSSGIGASSALEAAYLGAKVIFMVRNKEKTEALIQKMEETLGHPFEHEIVIYDQSSFASIASSFASLEGKRIDVIVFNAGIYFPSKEAEVKGIPLTLAVNALGTRYCFEQAYRYFKDARYIFTGSIAEMKPRGHNYARFLQPSKKMRFKQYGISKMGCRHCYEYASRVGADACFYHPGIAKTNIIGQYAPFWKKAGQAFLTVFTHSADKAALGIIKLLVDPTLHVQCPRGLFQISGYPTIKKQRVDEKDYQAFEAYYSEGKKILEA